MSVPSSKSTVTSTRPYLVTDLRIRCLGIPSISTSMGMATRLSISPGVMPGAFMMIFTGVLDTSGKASIGRFLNANQPAPARMTPASSTNSRCARENWTRRVSMSVAPALALPCRLQRDHGGGGDFLAGLQAARHPHRLAGTGQHRDGRGHEARARAHEDIGLVALAHHGLQRHGPALAAIGKGHAHLQHLAGAHCLRAPGHG